MVIRFIYFFFQSFGDNGYKKYLDCTFCIIWNDCVFQHHIILGSPGKRMVIILSGVNAILSQFVFYNWQTEETFSIIWRHRVVKKRQASIRSRSIKFLRGFSRVNWILLFCVKLCWDRSLIGLFGLLLKSKLPIWAKFSRNLGAQKWLQFSSHFFCCFCFECFCCKYFYSSWSSAAIIIIISQWSSACLFALIKSMQENLNMHNALIPEILVMKLTLPQISIRIYSS